MLELAERLVELTPAQLKPLDLPGPIDEAVRDTRRITAPIARKRQLHYLAKLMRREDDESVRAGGVAADSAIAPTAAGDHRTRRGARPAGCACRQRVTARKAVEPTDPGAGR